MKRIKNTLLLLAAAFSVSAGTCSAQIKNIKSNTVQVYGNCNMCKKNIETAANKKHISKAVWNEDTKIAMLSYDSTKTTVDAILKKIAYAGYDNQNYIAPDEAYNKLDQCCQYERKMPKRETKNDIKTNTPMVLDTVRKTTSNPTEIIYHLSFVYTAYFALKDALTKDDRTTSSSRASELYNAIKTVPMDKLTTEQHLVWMKYEKQLLKDAEYIKDVTAIEQQRKYFISLSKNMYEVMKVIKNNVTVYYDYCPMANDGKGASWLSLQKPIANPYFGKQMLTCGNVQETISK